MQYRRLPKAAREPHRAKGVVKAESPGGNNSPYLSECRAAPLFPSLGYDLLAVGSRDINHHEDEDSTAASVHFLDERFVNLDVVHLTSWLKVTPDMERDFLDGLCQVVFPWGDDWSHPPVCISSSLAAGSAP